MEADEVTEEPHTTMDAEEHHSSKDPSADDSQESPITETPLEPSTPETPVEPHTYETVLEPSISKASLEHSICKNPLETNISKFPEKHFAFHNSSPDSVSLSSSDTLTEDLVSESSSSNFSWAKLSIHTSEPEILQKHSFLGPSAQVYLDTSAKERKEDREDKEAVDVTDSTTLHSSAWTSSEKEGEERSWPSPFQGYTVHPVVPAKQAELVELAKARHRKKFGAQVDNLFQWEKNAALNAIQTGLYIGWRCPHYLWDCFRIGDESKCFCGHLLREHQIISDISVPCSVSKCRCLMFCFIPSRPEEVGEFWLKRRATFDPKAWRAQCRCKHSHEDHAATKSHPCKVKDCCCNYFESNFLCVACDRRWEEHETFFETETTRRRRRRPRGADYVPFAEMPTLQQTIISNSDFEALQKQGSSSHPSSHPSPPGLAGPHSLRPVPTSDPRT